MSISTMDEAVERLRQHLRDLPKLNKLQVGEELGDEDLRHCLDMAVSEFESMPPILGDFSVCDIPDNLLIKAGTMWALEQAGILQSRNRLQYSDNGLSVQVSDKAQEYQTWIQSIAQSYHQTAKQVKIQMNINRAYGGVSSSYGGFS